MTDNTQPEAGSTHIIRYALEMGLLWIDGDGRDKVREALDALDTLEAQLASIGAGGVSALMGAAKAVYAPLTGRTHELKTDAAVFAETLAGRKLFEIRKNDRGYLCGDILRLRATRLTGAEMAAGQPLIYTGQEELRRVVSILRGPRYGLADGWAIMSVVPVSESASHGQAPAQPVDFTTLGAAMRAIQQAIGLIGDPANERMRAVRRVLRGAVIVAEDSGELAAPAAGAVAGQMDDIDAVALARYKVEPSHDSMFHRFAVVAGDGQQQIYVGRETECQNMARKFSGAFLDGAFYQSQIAAAPTPAAQADSQPAPVAAFEVADAMADSQYLAGVSAGWNAANADDPNAALQKLHESRAGYLKPLSAARAPAESVGRDADRIEKWSDRVQRAHPKSEPEFWPDALRVKYMADEISDLRAARAPADSVLEDAARLDFIERHPEMSLRHRKGRWAFIGFTNYEYEMLPSLRAAINTAMTDTARKQGANHDNP